MTELLTDLGEQMATIRQEALRRLLLVEGRPDFHRKGGVYETSSTDYLVAKVEGHTDFLLENEASGFGLSSIDRLGRWAARA